MNVNPSKSSAPACASAPLISIVIASFNAGSTLRAAIESVASQGRDDTELIVIDGASTDETLTVISAEAHRIAYWVSEPDTGIYNAWNKGVRAARGLYVAFLGADDILLPGALNSYADLIGSSPKAEYLSSRVLYGDGPQARVIGDRWRWRRFRRYMTVAHVGSMHHRALFERIGLYDESFAITGDYELLLRAGPTLRAAFTTKLTARMGIDGISSGNSRRVFDESARAKQLHSKLPRWLITGDKLRAVIGHKLRGVLRR